MQEHTRTPVFQEKNGTWRHLTKTVNSLICTIEYGSSAGFSSKEDALESYQQSMDAYQDQISRLKKSRNMPFTFSEYLNYWLRDVYTPIFNSSSAQLRNRWVIELIILPHLHKDILLDCISTGYINKVLGDCQKVCTNGGYYAYRLLHTALRFAYYNSYIPDINFQEIRHYPEPVRNVTFYSNEQLRRFLDVASHSSSYLEIQLAGAFHQLGDNDKALSHLQAAFVIGEEDRLAVPFAENAAWIRPLLGQILFMAHRPFIEQILKLADELEDTMLAKAEDTQRPEGFTDNEWTVARFAASRLSNREIAEEMGFSEGTVKQYLNRIYGKLHLDGDARNKRRRLEKLLKQSPPAAVSKLP